MNEEREGPMIRQVPEVRYAICNGCKHLHSTAWVRGHDFHEDNHSCNHPAFEGEGMPTEFFPNKGREIIMRSREHYVNTPEWCPVRKPGLYVPKEV